jgi:hypothetical protein
MIDIKINTEYYTHNQIVTIIAVNGFLMKVETTGYYS